MFRSLVFFLFISSFAYAKDISCYIDVNCTSGSRTGSTVNSLLLDVSYLKYEDPQYNLEEESEVRIITLSFNIKKVIFTVSDRVEHSNRPKYNYDTKMLEEQYIKKDSFQAIQYIASKNVTVGLLHNYYLLRELAVTATVFF